MGAIAPLTPYYVGLSIIMALPLSFVIASLMLMAVDFVIAIFCWVECKEENVRINGGSSGLSYAHIPNR